ncbi:MAG: Eco57I restriction-modification methylase domain-containing protein, partial [Candidatus Pacearchaeota archaeon]
TTLSPFHWIFEFPEVFLEKGGFDVVVGNPPYGKIKNMKLQEEEKFFLSSVYKSLYQNIGTNVDFYKIFLKRSLTLTCDGKGYFSFLMPIMFWGDADSYDLRKEFYNFFILKILHFPLETTVKLFSGAINYEVSIFILKKNRTQSNFELRVSSYISSEDVRNLCNINFYKLEKSYVFKTSILGRLPLFQKAEYEKSILGFMRERFKPFGEYYNGESLGFILEGKLHETNDKKYLSSKPTGELAIASNHIKDWFVDLIPREEEKRWIKNGVKFRKRKVRDSIFNVENIGQLMDINPKIIGRQMANRGEKKKLHFMIHSGNEILTNGVRIIILKNRDVIFNKFFLALINSNLLDWQFKVYSLTYNVKPYELFDLFILNPQELILSGLSLIVDYILFSTALFRLNVEDGIYQQFFICLLNVEVFELYFKEKFYKDGLYPEQKEYLLELVLRYLKPINYDRWAELYWKKQLEGNLTEKEEKELVKLERENLATIQEVYQKLSKDKEIQAQIEKIKSHEWVKIIEGSS